jgi:hypothetical protein
MRGCRRWLIGVVGLGAYLMAGCLRDTLPTDVRLPRSNLAAESNRNAPQEKVPEPDPPPSDYLVSRTPSIQLEVVPTSSPAKPVEPVEMRMKEETAPAPPADLPAPKMEVHPAPPARPDAAPVQVLRALLEHHPEEEIKEQLKNYDEATRQTFLLLLQSIAELEQGGGLSQITPRELAAWTERLNSLTASLRNRAQLILEKMCFCSSIRNFGDYAPLPAEHTCLQPGEVAHVYVQVRNFSSQRQQDRYVTRLKGHMEIYEENNRAKPMITWRSKLNYDYSAAPRQDYYINFRFEVPRNCPAGLYTVRITVEDWTDTSPDDQQVPDARIAQRTLDFRVGGPFVRPSGTRLDEVRSAR